MSFKFTKIEKKKFSKESSEVDENELDNEFSEDEKINSINNYKINNNLSSMIVSHNNNDKGNDSLKNSEEKFKYNLVNNKNEQIKNQNVINEQNTKEENNIVQNEINNKPTETQFYELTTNGLVDKIKSDYEDIYMNQQNDINKFVNKLAKENSDLKSEISNLKIEIFKLKTKNELNPNTVEFKSESEKVEDKIINKETQITSEKIELEKKNIKEEYNYILNNISSNLITKNVKTLYNKLIQSKNELLNFQKINIMLQEENQKLREENEKIKYCFIEEKNKIIEKIIEIQLKTNADIDINKKLLVPIYDNFIFKNLSNREDNKKEINAESDKLNNVYLYYIEKIKNLTYEKNKLLTSNYDFFIKINELSQIIEEKNKIISEKFKENSSNELKVLNLEQQFKSINIKYNETSKQLKEAQEKINELSLEKLGNVVFQEKILDNKNNIKQHQQENKILQLNENLEQLTIKFSKLNKDYNELKETNEQLMNDNKLKKEKIENITKEKNQMIKEINNLKTELNIKEEQMKTKINEYENKIIYGKKNIYKDNNKKNDNKDMEQIQFLINNIYEKIVNNIDNNRINNNISLFLKNNTNDIAKLNEINKQINLFFVNKEIYSLITEENEKLKNHIKDIINLTLEKTNITYIEKFKENFINISFEQLILKIINYIKVYKICFLLQKIKTSINYGEKYINWLIEKDFLKSSNSSIEELKSEINNIKGEINDIKQMLKTDSLNFENKIKNFLSKDEIKVEINNIQKKYENIITDIFEYFLKYKASNLKYHENKEILILQIPIKTYNLMIENNMKNLQLISQSIDSWNLYVNNDLNENNDKIFQEIINMTNILNNLEYNNISEAMINNNIENEKNKENSEILNNDIINNENNNHSINNNDNNDNNENEDKISEVNNGNDKKEKENITESRKDNNNSKSDDEENESQNTIENKE